MIKNQWYAIMESSEIPSGKVVGVTRMGEKLVLWRKRDGSLACIYDQCCHRGASLSLGCIKEEQIECPFHGFLYDDTGKVTLIPANGKRSAVAERYHVHAYEVREQDGLVFLWYSDQEAPRESIAFFAELREGFVYESFSEVWSVHYTRAIENQLDVVHLPFVHKTTIGKGDKTLVDGPVVVWKDQRMTFYVHNVLDDGSRVAKKAEELSDYEGYFRLQFQMPNIWQNMISDQVRIFAAFAPIDDEHTRIYLRFYQKFLPIPVLGKAVANLSNIFNRVVLHQDREVVLTQLPKRSELRMGENLIPGDRPIVEFRKRRDELKAQAGQVPESLE